MIKVADIQRRYRFLVDDMKKTKKPMVVLNNGVPDAVLMDVTTYNLFIDRLNKFEENYLLAVADSGLKDFAKGKTVTLKKDQKLIDLIK
jgi:PHD/YefM family antitoxin component YafN of YafNO toxin-antitoxin module